MRRISFNHGLPAISLPLAVFLLSLTLRAVFIHHWGSTLTLLSDDLGYIESARRLVEEHVFSYWRPRLSPTPALGPTTYIMPGYPIFLAVFIWLFGDGSHAFAAARYTQAIFAAGSVCLAFYLGKHFGGRLAGLGAALLCALYPPFVLYSGLFLTETLFGFLLLLFVYVWLKLRPGDRRGYAFLGVVSGLAVLVRPTGVVLLVLALGALGLHGLRRDRRVRSAAVSAGLALVFFFCLTMSPWWVRNAVVFHRFVPLSEGGGNPLLLGTYVNLEGIKHGWHASWPVGKDPMETSRLQTSLARERLQTGFQKDFGRYLDWYTRHKFKLLWGRACIWGGEGKIPPTLTLYLHSFILAAGGLGLAYSLGRRLPGAGRILSVLAAFTVVHLVTYAHCRYALPLLPLLATFALVPFGGKGADIAK